MVTSEIYTKRRWPEHAQAVSRNSSRIMFVCMCRCAERPVCQKKEKKKDGGGMRRAGEREAEGEKGGRVGRGETENIR